MNWTFYIVLWCNKRVKSWAVVLLWFCCRRWSVWKRFLRWWSTAASARDEQEPNRWLILLWWVWRNGGFRQLSVFWTRVLFIWYRSDVADVSVSDRMLFHAPKSLCVCVFQVSALSVTWDRWVEVDSRPSPPAHLEAGAAGWGTSALCPRPPNMLTAEKSPPKGTTSGQWDKTHEWGWNCSLARDASHHSLAFIWFLH